MDTSSLWSVFKRDLDYARRLDGREDTEGEMPTIPRQEAEEQYRRRTRLSGLLIGMAGMSALMQKEA